jgi:Zn-dependent protease with chaperone function
VDFFERQDKARRNTKLLVFYFSLAVLSLLLAVNVTVLLILTGFGNYGLMIRNLNPISSASELSLPWSPAELLFWVTIGTLAVILLGSVFKTLQLARGGSAVAELLDGRLINANTSDADERKLLNVVEEMSIASGVPVPQVYVMDGEAGINAFSAGHSASDAAISVTRGCMKLLSRDELQGVIGHEFSHILNGDMRLNLHLMGLVFGILCLTVIGRIFIQTRGRKNLLPLVGLALIIIGWAGVFFGRLIQAAVSRQREGLADASAVQFTRNPAALAGALKKILIHGSRIDSPHAEEASHLFFANGLDTSLFATHPLLTERIRALRSSLDGKFPRVPQQPTPAISRASEAAQRSHSLQIPGLPRAQGGKELVAAPFIAEHAVVANIGQATTQHLCYAMDFHQAIPPGLQIASRDPLGAGALVCAFLLASDPSTRQKQLEDLDCATSEAIREEIIRIWPEIQGMPPQAKIPLVDLALPALRRLSPQQFEQFRATTEKLVAGKAETDLFAYMLRKIVVRHLERNSFPQQRPITEFYALRPLAPDCGVLLSATAYAGQENATAAYAAFSQGAESLSHAAHCEISWLPPDQCDLLRVDVALARLSQAVPQIKKNVLNACAQTVAVDGVIQEGEAEILRAIADTLDCPVPPFLQPEKATAPLPMHNN